MTPLASIPALHSARLGADHWVLRHEDEVLSWGELDRRSNRRAAALRTAGVQKDDLVTLSLPNGSSFYEFTFAIWKLGATPHIVSWRLPTAELNAILEVARPRLIVASARNLQKAVGARPPEFGASEFSDDAHPEIISTYWKAMSSGGSTGRPKVIVDHQPAMTDPADPGVFGMPADSVTLNPGPLYHNAPMILTHSALFRGNSVVGMIKFDAEECLRLIDTHRVAWSNFVPTMMSRIWRLPDEVRSRYDVSSLQRVWHMAAPMPDWLKRAWIDWLGAQRIWELYGGTERQGWTTLSGNEWLDHPGSVGRPHGCKVKILDEASEMLPPGSVGEIFLLPDSGPESTYHYIGSEPSVIAGGWESIGDFGWLDEDGYLYLADRRTDMILSGGANVYPAEVENALMEHPDVEVAVVIGLPHEDLGAYVHAIVKPADQAVGRLSEDKLLDFMSGRLTRYKVPRSIEFTTEQLRDDAGKVRRSSLREARIAAISRGTMQAT